MKIKFFVMSIILILSGFISAQAQTKPCGCADKQDLLNLLNMSQRAIQEYNSQLDLLNQREERNSQPEMYSRDSFAKLINLIETALADVSGNGATKYRLPDMSIGDCSITEKDTQNECLRQIYKSLFDVYQKACEETISQPGLNKSLIKMKQVIEHQISAYQAMQNFILKMLKSLPKSCRPNDWFGYVVYQKVKTQVSNKTIPPRPRRLDDRMPELVSITAEAMSQASKISTSEQFLSKKEKCRVLEDMRLLRWMKVR